MMAFVLKDLELDLAELLSVVDKGASGNEDIAPRIVLMKRDRVAKEGNMTAEEILAKLPEEERNVLLAAMQAATKVDEEEEKKVDESKEPEEEVKADDGEEVDKEEDEEEMEKSLPKSVQKRLADAEKLAKRVQALEDEKVMASLVEKAKTDLPNVPGIETEALASLLKAARHNLDKADVEKFEGVLKSCSDAIGKGELFAEAGTTHIAKGSAVEQINAIAKSLQAKDPTMSEPKARTQACESNPKLFAQYQAERAEVK